MQGMAHSKECIVNNSYLNDITGDAIGNSRLDEPIGGSPARIYL